MPHSVTCGACKASFSIPDEVWDKRVHGQVATLKCRHCKAPIEVDGRTRRGSAVNIATSPAAIPASSLKDAPAVPDNATVAAPKEPLAPVALTVAAVTPKPIESKINDAAPTAAKPALQATKGSALQSPRTELKQPEPGPAAKMVGADQPVKAVQPTLISATSSGKSGALAPTPSTIKRPEAPNTQERRSGDRVAGKQGSLPAGLKFTKEPKPKNVGATQPRAKLSSSTSELDWESAAGELWVVGFGVDDDREITTTQLEDYIIKGQLDGDTIVWKDGMADWLPISKVPELARILKPKPVAPAPAPTVTATAVSAKPTQSGGDDGDDETVIYRPGSNIAAEIAAAAAESLAPAARAATLANSIGGKKAGAGVPKVDASVPRVSAEPAPRAPLRPTASSSLNQPEVQAPKDEVVAKSATELAAAKAAAMGAKAAGGPPPLRRQPSRPDEPLVPNKPAAHVQQLQSNEEFVTSVREYAPSRAGAAPPPLPPAEPKEPPAAKPAIFPPAVQTTQPFSPVPVEATHSLRATPSFAPRPSDIAALTKIRPKFPKWLPFAVLAGLVLTVAVMAALSWIRGDNPEAERKRAPDVSGPLEASPSLTTRSTANTATTEKPSGGDLSSGFASKFAQAAAKQRPTARFDRDGAEKALAPAFAKAAGCHNKGEPTGTANVTISIAPSGQVLSVTVAQPFATTFTADCIRSALREASVPPFQGSPGRLAHSIAIH